MLRLSFTHFLVRFRRVPVPAERLSKSVCFSFRPLFVSSYVTSPEAPNGLPLTLLRTVSVFNGNEGVVIRSDRSVFLIGCLYIFGTYAGICLFRYYVLETQNAQILQGKT